MAFFSYAWTTEAHKARVLNLVKRLRGDGVNALIDQVDLRDGEDIVHFMERIATDPKLNKVVAVCDRNYAEKVDARTGGSGTEGTIMSPEVYGQIGEGPNKYVAVVFEVDALRRGYVPTMFATRLYIDMSTDDLLEQHYLRLLRFLFDRPEPPTPLGKPPAILFEDHPASVASLAKGLLVRAAVERGRGVMTPWQEFTEVVVDALRAFTAPMSDRQWDIQKAVRQLDATTGSRDALAETVRYLSREGQLRGPMLVDLFQTLGNLPQDQARMWETPLEATAHTRLAVTELVLYVTAVLIQEGRPDPLREVLLSDYLAEYHGQQRLVAFDFLQQDVRWFDDQYNRVFGTRWISPVAEWLKGRCTLATVGWRDVMQADALLHLQTQLRPLNPGEMRSFWWGPTGAYWGTEGQFPLFLRMTSQAFLTNWLPLFGVEQVAQLRTMVNARNPDGSSLLRFDSQGRGSPRSALSLDELGTRV
jgi:TIR domain